jgi:hypothetical protein
MTTIERTTDLTAWLNTPITLTRTIDGRTWTFHGVLTYLAHGADSAREDFRDDSVSAHLLYTERGRTHSTAPCVPYGSTIDKEVAE